MTEHAEAPGTDMLDLPARVVSDTDVAIGETGTAVFSPDRTYRYGLTRRWYPNLPYVAFVMLNPSTADAFQLDPTVKLCRTRAQRLGAGGLIVLNAFGFRSTDPRALKRVADPVGPDNDAVIASYLLQLRVSHVILGWGAHGSLHGRDREMMTLLRSLGVNPLHLRATGAGQPGHPLYIPLAVQPTPYRQPEIPPCTMPRTPRAGGDEPLERCGKPADQTMAGWCLNGHVRAHDLCEDDAAAFGPFPDPIVCGRCVVAGDPDGTMMLAATRLIP